MWQRPSPTAIALTAGMTALTGQQLPQPPTVGGYNLCYLRPEATSAATTQDDNQAPVVASWQAGSGRVLCYTGEADGKYAGQLAAWQHAGDLFAGLARWTAGAQDALPAGMVATQRVRDGVLDIRLHLDPEYQQSSPSGTPAIRLLRSAPGSPPKAELLSMLWVGADELACRIPMNGRETLLPTLQIGPNAEKTFAPACLPYSPEFAPPDPAKGKSALSQVATMTGGVERVDVNSIWASLPRKHRMVSASPSIMVLALVVFLLEILERRTGLLAGLRRRKRVMQPTAQAAPAVARPRRRGRRRGAARTEKNAGSQPETTGAEETQPESQPDESSTFEAMRQVRSRRRR